jgi:hypothetical protein
MFKEDERKKHLYIAFSIIALILIVAGIAIYFMYFYSYRCGDYTCFSNSLKSCDKSSYINEDSVGSWYYTIQGKSDKLCIVNVKLIQAKEGELGIDKLKGYSMDCEIPLGDSRYPEKDLSTCHGRLKEELITLQINKLFAYIKENLGQVKAELNSVV